MNMMSNKTHSTVSTAVASVGTAFDAAKNHEHVLRFANLNPSSNFKGWVYSIHLHMSSIVSATTLTVSLSLDPEGDFKVLPDTEAEIAAGITTSGSGCLRS